MLDVVQLVKEGSGHFEWSELVSKHKGFTLYIKIFRDAMKFDNVPVLNWNRKVINSNQHFNGVRLPASAYELQQIADLLNCMLLTPKVIDMIWLQAGIKFDSIVSVRGKIVATSNITDLHPLIEKSITKNDPKKIISCVGKYWCLVNELLEEKKLFYGKRACCNYGWFAKVASGPALTPGIQCWQRPGFKHDDSHLDPSQTIRLMHRRARLISPDGKEESVDLLKIAQDKILCHLISHEGPLRYLRQAAVPPLKPLPSAEPVKIKKADVDSETQHKDKPKIDNDKVISIDKINIENKYLSKTTQASKNNIIQLLINIIISIYLKIAKTFSK